MSTSPADARRAALAAANRPSGNAGHPRPVRAALTFGLVFGAVSASRAIAAIVLSPAPFTWTALRWPLLGFVGGFALFATLAALALATGGRPQSFGDIEVSSWFAWWVAGGCVAAIAALFVRERVGDAWWGALVWTLFLVALWAFVRRGRRRSLPEV